MLLTKRTNLALMAAAAGLALAIPAAGQELDAAKRGEAAVQRWCISCHLPQSAASGADAAPTLHQIRALARGNPDRIRTFLSRPHSPMPPLQLSRADIADIVAYLGSAE